MFSLGKIVRLLRAILDVCRSIEKLLRLRQPGQVYLKIVSEEGTGMLKFKIILPVAGAHDVVSRNLSIKIGDEEPQVVELAGDDTESAEYTGAQGTTVSGQLTDVDDAGNVSPARDYSFTLTDTLAPPVPGEIGLLVIEELPDTEPEPEPEPPADPTDPTDPTGDDTTDF